MKGKLNFIVGLLLGVFLVAGTGAAAAVVETVTATLNQAPIYVDGTRVELTAYNIGGYNYFKLRDIAELVDFGVEWDQEMAAIQIDTTAGYQNGGLTTNHDLVPGTARYVPKAGDKITCQDGYIYEITDVSRYNNSMFATEETSALPAPSCDWNLLPNPELPANEARHFTSGGRQYLFMRNLYETRRMQYTLYNAIGANPQTWQNGKPVTRADGSPLVRVYLSIPNDVNAYSFWPWRSEQITELFNSCPPGDYYFESWDVFCDGAFRYTEYYVYVK